MIKILLRRRSESRRLQWMLSWSFGFLVAALIFHARSTVQKDPLSEVKAELAADAARISRLIEAEGLKRPWQLDAVLEQVRQESHLDILWIRLRNGNRDRQPVFTIRPSAAGDVLVETLPLRIASDSRFVEAANRTAVIEIAASLNKPLRNRRGSASRIRGAVSVVVNSIL